MASAETAWHELGWRTLVVVPAWNEEEALPKVLSEIEEYLPGTDVVVVSDGSTDGTAAVAAAGGATVIELPFNLGVGGAMRAGFRYAMLHGYSHAVQIDADGQHDPSEVPTLVARMQETGADLVIGARFAGTGTYEARGPRRWAMRLLSAVISRVARVRLDDTTSGFKLIGPRALALFSREYPAEYLGDTVEALVIAARAGLKIEQQPVNMRPRGGGQPSHNPLQSAVFLFRVFLALVVALFRPREGVRT